MTLSHEFDLAAELARLPAKPGVYRMYGADGELLYVGKAKVLKNRVRSYFQDRANLSPRIRIMVDQVAWFETTITGSEVEALILESNMVKTLRPKYNILLRDDKKFPWLGLSDEAYPRLFMTRTPVKTGKTRYFGPYTNSGDMYAALNVVRKHFPLRQRRKPLFKNRPCMNYYIGTCLGPCQSLVTPDEYGKVVRQVELFLKGKTDDLLELLAADIAQASEELNFEHAAKLRDRYLAVERLSARQNMVSDDDAINQDVIASACDVSRCLILVLKIRKGKLIGQYSQEIPLAYETTPEEAYTAFMEQYYPEQPPEDLPEDLVLQYPIADEALFQDWWRSIRQKKAILHYPQRGPKKSLLDLGIQNARQLLDQAKFYDARKLQRDPAQALMELQEALHLPDYPSRIECYDISHFQGSQTVASMVVFTDGVPDKDAYRRFKIHVAEGKPDDFKSMLEVISRRFKHSKAGDEGWNDPDLVIIDGGKGQLSSAVKALHEVGVSDQPIVSLAKRMEEVFIPGQEHSILLPRDSTALFLLQQIRDEAHRFAITYHRTLRAKATTKTDLDTIPGLGPKRKQKLLDHYGTLASMRQAPLEEIARVLGLSVDKAQPIYDALLASAS